MSALTEVMKLFNSEVHEFCIKINKEYPDISIDDMLQIWCEQQDIDISSFNIKKSGCKYTLMRGNKSGQQCSSKTSAGSSYCNKHKKKSEEEEEEPEEEPEEEEEEEAEEEAEEEEAPEEEAEEEEEPEDDEDDDADKEPKIQTCAHKFNKGARANDRCSMKPQANSEYCAKHKKSSSPKASKPKASPAKQKPSKSSSKKNQCDYVFSRGDKKGQQCDSSPKEGSRCSKHKNNK
jgi:hypothetical protein